MKNSPLIISSPKSLPGLGMSICPGKVDPNAFSGPCARDLKTDLLAIKDWGASMIVTLMENFELELLHVRNMGDMIINLGMEWRHWPVIDQTPLLCREIICSDPWKEQCNDFLNMLNSGKRIFVHCRGGLGRTGTLAARLLIEKGMDPKLAIAEVRAARPGAIETESQKEYLLNKSWIGHCEEISWKGA